MFNVQIYVQSEARENNRCVTALFTPSTQRERMLLTRRVLVATLASAPAARRSTEHTCKVIDSAVHVWSVLLRAAGADASVATSTRRVSSIRLRCVEGVNSAVTHRDF